MDLAIKAYPYNPICIMHNGLEALLWQAVGVHISHMMVSRIKILKREPHIMVLCIRTLNRDSNGSNHKGISINPICIMHNCLKALISQAVGVHISHMMVSCIKTLKRVSHIMVSCIKTLKKDLHGSSHKGISI